MILIRIIWWLLSDDNDGNDRDSNASENPEDTEHDLRLESILFLIKFSNHSVGIGNNHTNSYIGKSASEQEPIERVTLSRDKGKYQT